MSAATPRRFRRQAAIAAALIAYIFSVHSAGASNIVTRNQYEKIGDPLVDTGQIMLILVSPTSSPYSIMLTEAWRLASLNFLIAAETKVDNAMAQAITTNTVKNVRVAVEPIIQGGKVVLDKLAADLRWYEERDGRFSFPGFQPTDPADLILFEQYQAIRRALQRYEYTVSLPDGTTEQKVLENAEEEFARASQAVREGLLHVLDRLTNANYSLGSLRTDSGYMAERLERLNEVVFGIQHMALELSRNGNSPRRQIRASVTNRSKDLVFFVQVYSYNDGDYTLREDTRYPVAIYPNAETGVNQTWLPIQLRDKVVVRVATMGEHRQRIRSMRIKGNYVRPDLNTLSRNFYYLGYEADSANGAVIVSRWYPVKETYRWEFRGGFAPGETANEPQLSSSDGREFRGFGPSLEFVNDRMEWITPAGRDTATDMPKARAIVTGTTEVLKQGPTSSKRHRQLLSEDGSGDFEMTLIAW